MTSLGQKRSVIREIFEYGRKRKSEIGADNVFDFSLGNPSVPAPPCVEKAMQKLLAENSPVAIHGYTSAQGDLSVRQKISAYINKTHGTKLDENNIYMTCGAAASLCISLRALTASSDDEFITFTPFFPEYRVFVEAAGAKLTSVASNPKNFQIDFDNLAKAINKNTKGIIINSPNNPSGVVLSEKTILRLCEMLAQKQKEYNHEIYLIADEPYRELVYDGISVPYPINYYDNTIICYSFSKSLSLPGERIGYIVVSDKMNDGETVYAAICGAGRALGYVCAPSMFQKVVAECQGQTSDLSIYVKNRDLLYSALERFGYHCIHPDGAFYLFFETPETDANAFCERAKKYELLLVPGDDFGCPSFVRIAYCVSTEQIEKSLPAFEKLMKEYK